VNGLKGERGDGKGKLGSLCQMLGSRYKCRGVGYNIPAFVILILFFTNYGGRSNIFIVDVCTTTTFA